MVKLHFEKKKKELKDKLWIEDHAINIPPLGFDKRDFNFLKQFLFFKRLLSLLWLFSSGLQSAILFMTCPAATLSWCRCSGYKYVAKGDIAHLTQAVL